MKTHEIAIFENSQTVKAQDKVFFGLKGKQEVKVVIRWDDRCGNGHNTFSVTGTLFENGRNVASGCIHETIAELKPSLAKYIKWHLVNSNAPLYYIENTQYHAKCGNLEAARRSAVWPDASLEDLLSTEKLMARLPKLMAEFKRDVEDLGFDW